MYSFVDEEVGFEEAKPWAFVDEAHDSSTKEWGAGIIVCRAGIVDQCQKVFKALLTSARWEKKSDEG
jgi:hypothetical protein